MTAQRLAGPPRCGCATGRVTGPLTFGCATGSVTGGTGQTLTISSSVQQPFSVSTTQNVQFTATDSNNNDATYQAPISQVQSLFQSYSRDRSILDTPDTVNDAYGLGGKRKGYQRHPGYAWAARRSALADLGGLGDIGILGAADRHMAYALLGHVELSLNPALHPSYRKYWLAWQANAEEHIQRKVGVVPGTLLHYWHGPKTNRRYHERWKMLIDNKFDWRTDLKRDPQGVWALSGRNWKLRDDLIAYFAQRAEDSSSL